MIAEITAELTLCSNCVVKAKILDLVESDDVSKIKQMRNALKTLVQGGDMAILPAQNLPKGKKANENTGKLISEKQISTVRGLLETCRMNEADFCREHNIDNLEKLPRDTATTVIGDLINKKSKLQ